MYSMSISTPQPTFQRTLFWKHLTVLGCLAVLVRVLGAVAMGSGAQPSLWEYEVITQNMLRSGEFVMEYRDYGEYYALLAPGYPYLSYLVYLVFGTNHQLMLVIQFLLTLGLGCCAYLLSWRLFYRQSAACLATFLVLVHPGIAVYGATKLHNFNLYVPLFYAVLLVMVVCHQVGGWRWFALLGLVGGLATLARATIMPVIVIWLGLYLAIGSRRPPLKRCGEAALALALLFLVNLPWTVRNYRVLGRPVFSQTNGWEQFWVGNNLHATGTHYTQDRVLILSLKPPQMQSELASSTSELQDAEIFRRYTLAYVQDHPVHFCKGLFQKAWRFWWFHPQTGLHYPPLALLVYKLIYLVLLGLAVLGLRVCVRERLWRAEMIYPLVLVLSLAALHSLAFGEMRHRWAIEPVLLLFGGVGLGTLVGRLRNPWLTQQLQGTALPAREEPRVVGDPKVGPSDPGEGSPEIGGHG